jgi:hypothetical protein
MGQKVSKLLCSCFDRDKKVTVPKEQYEDNFNKYDFGELIHEELETLIRFYVIKNS